MSHFCFIAQQCHLKILIKIISILLLIYFKWAKRRLQGKLKSIFDYDVLDIFLMVNRFSKLNKVLEGHMNY
jgi:hypothetical protein